MDKREEELIINNVNLIFFSLKHLNLFTKSGKFLLEYIFILVKLIIRYYKSWRTKWVIEKKWMNG